ncbi:MAG: hypothetical protein AAF497_24135 [Planctomycetota bacterium]
MDLTKLPPELQSRLQNFAEASGSDISELLRIWLDREEQLEAWRAQQTRLASADADAGNFASDQEIESTVTRYDVD